MVQRGKSINLDRTSLPEAFDTLKTNYEAAKVSRYRRLRTGVLSTGSHADWHYRGEVGQYLRMMEQARDFDRNDCIVGQAIDRACANTLQGGMMLDAKTGDDAIDEALESRWNEWANDPDLCDVSREKTFHDMEHFALRQTMVDGDISILGLKSGQLEMMEGHRLRTPQNTSRNVVHGVLLADNREHIEYWFTNEDVSPNTAINRVSDMRRVPTRNSEGFRQVFHVLNPKRCTQTRGVTVFAPIFDTLGMFEDVNFAALVKQQISSCFAIIRKRDNQFDGDQGASLGGTSVVQTGDGSARTLEGIAPGMEIRGQPGEEISGFAPNIPSQEFFNHMRYLLTIIGVNIGMPLVLTLMDASETNFSGFRGAVDQARMGFRRNQRWLIDRLHKPLYRFKVRQWIAKDDALFRAAQKMGAKIFNHVWTPPAWPYIQPLQDAGTDLLILRNGLSSPRRVQANRGREHEEVVAEIVADNSLAIRTAKAEATQINDEFNDGAPVHWRELLSLPTPDGVSITIGPEGGAESPAKKSADGEGGGKPGKTNGHNRVAAMLNGSTNGHEA